MHSIHPRSDPTLQKKKKTQNKTKHKQKKISTTIHNFTRRPFGNRLFPQ